MTQKAPLPFSIRQLQYAVAVAEELSFSRAAERCGVSQPSLSAQLGELEDALGVRLFERERKRVLPTPAGEALVKRASEILVAADDLLEAARQLVDPFAGTLRLGVIPTVSPYLLPLLTPALRARFPRLSVHWVEEKTEPLALALSRGSLDAVILAQGTQPPDVEMAPIGRDNFVLASPLGHPLSSRKGPASAADLRDANVLLLEDGHCLRQQALSFCTRARAAELEFRATSLSTLAQMVAGGAGVTLLPQLAVPTETTRARLHVRPFADPAPHRILALAWRRSSPITPALRELAGAMRDAYPVAGPKARRA